MTPFRKQFLVCTMRVSTATIQCSEAMLHGHGNIEMDTTRGNVTNS